MSAANAFPTLDGWQEPTGETLDHLRLALVPGLGPKLTRAVLEHFGTAAAVLQASVSQLQTVPLIGDKLSAKIAAGLRDVDAVLDRELALLRKHRVTVTVAGSPGYPQRLSTIDDAPGLLYSRGTWSDADRQAVGIVGSRSCTSYGKRMAATIAAGLVRAGYTVVSGLALGIDGAAHEGALDAGGRTVAVLGGGLAKIYPPQHAGLADRVTARGVLMTETPMVVDTRPEMFPARNRIISALSRAIVVIEANDRSGALITARLAGEQGREVFVVPGNADSGHSAGSHELIRKGARLVRNAEDILEDLRGIAPPDPPPPRREKRTTPELPFTPPAPAGPPPGLDAVQLQLWEALAAPRHADELARELGLEAAAVSTLVFKLELKKAVRKLPGGMIERR